MKYQSFLTTIRKEKLYIFTPAEIAKYFPRSASKTIQNQVQLWEEKNLLLRLRRGLYKINFAEGGPDLPDLYIANRLYEPSYVSLETALSFYSIHPEVAAVVTSVTVRQTSSFKNSFGVFQYKSCKAQAYCGYKIMLYEGFKVYIAEPEKAIVDFLYFKHRYGEKVDIDTERLDKERLRNLVWNKVLHYAGLYNKKTLSAAKEIRKSLK